MNSRYAGTMGIQRLIKEIKRDTGGGGGPPGPDSVGTSQIINGTITTADIALGTIDISNLSASCIASLSGGGLTANSVNSSHIINGSILTADICDNAITYAKIAANAVTNTRIDNGAVTHAKLSSDCIQSHNIVDRTILGIDISLGQIGEAHFDAEFTTTLEEIGDAIKELSKLQGIIGIRNVTTYDQTFSYALSYKHPITAIITQFASYTNLDYTLTASHFFKLPSLTHYILIEVDNGGIGIGVEGANIINGGIIEETDGNSILLTIDDVNVMVEINVAI
jgi:hypothetical protein